ncbi:hypothetical protein A2333_01615 [Candidatus Wolfebacteria bacterium RIFOXYB2_FULL_49_7]|nr:MAG: hypothetical protein A2333_01615 [Candidatus Wolfebacteria bacterium RIFOXYB2_FULL_49_7]
MGSGKVKLTGVTMSESKFTDRKFELLRELVPTSTLTSKIILKADINHPGGVDDHIDRIELGQFGGEQFLIKKERFNY